MNKVKCCEHPDCNNSATHSICEPHINLILQKENVVEQCAGCGKLVAVLQRPEEIKEKYVHCLVCRSCTGSKADEKKIFIGYPLSGRVVKGEPNDNNQGS